jgi:hypothetical protein
MGVDTAEVDAIDGTEEEVDSTCDSVLDDNIDDVLELKWLEPASSGASFPFETVSVDVRWLSKVSSGVDDDDAADDAGWEQSHA